MSHNFEIWHLSLARSGAATVGLSSSGDGASALTALDGGSLDQVRVGKRSLAHTSKTLAAARSLTLLLIGSEIERDE